MPMHVIGFLNSKGGVGKSTLATAVAVRAAQDSKRVCLVDLDPQGSTQDWWRRRGGPGNPMLLDGVERASEAIARAQSDGWDWVILDGPPGSIIVTDDAIAACTLVVIPIRASTLDIDASRDAIGACEDAGVSYMVVVNGVSGKSKDKLLEEAQECLFHFDVPIAKTTITTRNAYVKAMTSGHTGAEKDKAAAGEVDAFWCEIKAAALKAVESQKERGAA